MVTALISSLSMDDDASSAVIATWIPEVTSDVVVVLCHAITDALGDRAGLVSKSTASVFVPYTISKLRFLQL